MNKKEIGEIFKWKQLLSIIGGKSIKKSANLK